MDVFALDNAPSNGAAFLNFGDSLALVSGERIGDVRVTALSKKLVELRTPGQLNGAVALLALVPIGWCALSWLTFFREGLDSARLPGCLVLSVMAIVSAVLIISSLGTDWQFDGRRNLVSHRVGPFPRTHDASRIAGLKIHSERTGVAQFAEQELVMDLVDSSGRPVLRIGQWNRREVDRAKVDALAGAIRNSMGWSEQGTESTAIATDDL
jgi:hypothetical protein